MYRPNQYIAVGADGFAVGADVLIGPQIPAGRPDEGSGPYRTAIS